MQELKCVVVGDTDRSCPKTKLLLTYTTNSYPGDNVSKASDNYTVKVPFDGRTIDLRLWDTTGEEDYPNLRRVTYSQTDVFVFVFSLVSPQSLENVRTRWISDVKEHCFGRPFILVGLDLDLRNEFDEHADEYRAQGMEPISRERGEEVKDEIGAYSYIECSSKLQLNIKDAFESAVKAVEERTKRATPRPTGPVYVKCVMVGDDDETRGRTNLLLTYELGVCPNEYIPTVFDIYSMRRIVDDREINLQLMDAKSGGDYEKLRPLSYPQTDVFMVIFSLVSPQSLENVQKFWIPEIRLHCPNAPYVLVGVNWDLRDEYNAKGMETVSKEKGEEMKNKIGAHAYIECSAKILYNVREALETAIMCVLNEVKAPAIEIKETTVAVFGMPKVGKSLLVDKLTSKMSQRALVTSFKRKSSTCVETWQQRMAFEEYGKKRFGDSLGQLNGKDIIVCVYDTTDMNSFTWISKKVKKLAEKRDRSSIIVVGTKKDCTDSRCVTSDDVKQIGSVLHFEVSAEKDDFDNLLSHLSGRLFD